MPKVAPIKTATAPAIRPKKVRTRLSKSRSSARALTYGLLGWREWIQVANASVFWIKCKVDTGAKTSSLHAESVEVFRRRRQDFVRFDVFPEQRSKKTKHVLEAPLLEMRWVKSSTGQSTLRPVIELDVKWTAESDLQKIEVTLVNRDLMGFRMLLGREAIKGGRFLVDCSQSFVLRTKQTRRKKGEL